MENEQFGINLTVYPEHPGFTIQDQVGNVVAKTPNMQTLDRGDYYRCLSYMVTARNACAEAKVNHPGGVGTLIDAINEITPNLIIMGCPICEGSGIQPETVNDACHNCGGVGETVQGTILPEDLRALRKARNYLLKTES